VETGAVGVEDANLGEMRDRRNNPPKKTGVSRGLFRPTSPSFPAPGELANLLRVGKGQLARQGSLQVSFEKLHVPTRTLEERHVDAVAGTVVARHAYQYRANKRRNIHSACGA
jgi:hypothetical protein